MNFEIKSSRFYYMTKKSRQKVKYLENEKAFFIIFKGLSMKQITQLFLEGKSPTLDCFNWEIIGFYQSSFGNEVDFRDIKTFP